MKEGGDELAAPFRSVRRLVRRRGLRGDERGLAATEFALLAIPFFMLLMGIIEIGLFLVVNFTLSNATASIARQVRVGTIVASGMAAGSSSGTALSRSDFKSAICANFLIVSRSTCAANLQIDIRTIASFSDTSIPTPLTSKAFSTSGFCYYSGVPGKIVVLRAYYLWPLITPLLWPALANVTSSASDGATTAGHWTLASSTYVFVNEPNRSTINNGSGC